jgi:hypothetical protein
MFRPRRYQSVKAAALNGAGGKQRPKTTSDKRHALLSADFCNKIGTERDFGMPSVALGGQAGMPAAGEYRE